ncbi:hypothetical protein MUK42_33757 [Musa troglodytarum]|uniref:Uncharacterized protein n=1 Tax=Musa troglodytarum TaxID=320322 RepID=A0A9E7E8W8_9LILI|nr:hypothetical protein MUK42_33757 [Musa troglodytarum]
MIKEIRTFFGWFLDLGFGWMRDDLSRIVTGEAFQWLAGNATKRLDIIAQYWQLLAQSENPESGDYGFSAEEMEVFGEDEGRAVYRYLADAADRKDHSALWILPRLRLRVI